MNLPATLFVLRCLVADTFRQALAARSFWLMPAVTLLAVAFCLGVGVEGGAPLRPPGEIELYGGDGKPMTGPNPRPGHLTLGFGAVRVQMFRDTQAEVACLHGMLACWVAGTIGTLAALVWTAGFIPAFLDPAAASVVLAKPAPRGLLLAGKVLGVVALVALQEAIFFGATWTALGLRTGVWSSTYLLCIPVVTLYFSALYGASVLVAVWTRSTAAAVFGAVLFWGLCFAANFGRHSMQALPYLQPNGTPFSPVLRASAEAGYWALPKPADFMLLLDDATGLGAHFDVVPRVSRIARDHGGFDAAASVATSLLASVALLLIAARQFQYTDY